MAEPRDASWSLRRRLFAIVAWAALATLATGGGAMYWAATAEDQKLLDTRLADIGQAVLAFTGHELAEIQRAGRTDRVHGETAATLGTRYHYQVWSADGSQLLLRSHRAPAAAPMAPLDARGFRTVHFDGEAFRVFATQGGGERMILQVAECLDERQSEVALVSYYFLAFLVVPFAGISGLTGWQLDRSLRALDASAVQLDRRSPIDLAPLAIESPPKELVPMVGAINGLLGRIERALSMERGFTAVAAHELRTPLAGLRAQAQRAATAPSAASREAALAAVMQGVDKASHMLEQLLDLARVESLAMDDADRQAQVDIDRALAHVLPDLAGEIERRGLRLETHGTATRAHSAEWGMVLLLRNLLSNAVRYTPDGGRVALSVSAGAGGVTVRVDDSGPGIPADLRPRAFQRFERLGRSDGLGVGLGMSIVQSVAAAQGAALALLDSPLGGLRVEVVFPAAA